MFRRKVKSALLIDFDNIVGAIGKEFGQSIPNWMAWLEDGKFEEKERKRRFITKRVYWNAPNDKYRAAFERNNFEAITCRSIVTNKSSADMIIALDALQSTYDVQEIQEYVLLTTDTDFVPLVNKLGDRSKQTVNAGNRNNLSFGVYTDHADIVIGLDALAAAFKYERKVSVFAKILSQIPRFTRVRTPASLATPPPRSAPVKSANQNNLLGRAGEHIATTGGRTPGLAISRKVISRTLANHMPEFTTTGKSCFLGQNSYNQMLERIVKQRTDLRLHKYGGGGRGVSFRPQD